MDDLVTRLRALADCDARAGEPLGKCMREAADEIERLTKHIAIMHDVADQRDQIIMERQAEIARLTAALAEAEAQVEELNKGESREWVRSSLLDDLEAERLSLKAALAEAEADRVLAAGYRLVATEGPEFKAARAERERIADALDYEASVCPCHEDAKVISDCALLVRADFSYDAADRIRAALTRPAAQPEGE